MFTYYSEVRVLSLVKMNYKGAIIEESLVDTSILKNVAVLSTEVEQVTEEHKTPWVKQWTLHMVEVPEDKAEQIAEEISQALDPEHPWYADYKNDTVHFIIFKNKVFKIDRTKKEQYAEATSYGISIGIPEYQVDFAPNTVVWKR